MLCGFVVEILIKIVWILFTAQLQKVFYYFNRHKAHKDLVAGLGDLCLT